jgi:hypothetical protein
MTNAFTTTYAQIPIRAAEAPTIAKEANLYGFPTVDNLRIQPTSDRQNPEYKAPYNRSSTLREHSKGLYA